MSLLKSSCYRGCYTSSFIQSVEMDISKIVVGLNIMILYFQQTYGSITSFLPTGPVKVNDVFRISCKINPFATGADATLNRNGSLLNTCFQNGGCATTDTKTINGAQFSFTGDSEGIHLTIDHLPPSEVGLLYVCVKGVSVEYTVVESSSGSGGGSTDWKWWYNLLIVLGVLFIIAIIFCCIFNTRCKFGDRFTDLPLSFTFPSGNGSKVNITSIGHIGTPFPKSEPDKKEVTPQDGKGTITPTNKSGDKEVTPNQGSQENPTLKIKPVDKKVTPHAEILLNNELNIAKSTIASTPPRSGAKQQLYPIIKGEGGNGNGEDLPR